MAEQPQLQVSLVQGPHGPYDPADPAPRWFFTVVVAGGMIPRIHHPFWYRDVGAITAEEFQAGQGTMIVTPPIASFNAGTFEITCQQDKWQIGTTSFENRGRALEVIRRVFDERLRDTPVQAFGINTNGNLLTAAPNVSSALARMMLDGGLALPAEGRVESVIQHQDVTDGRVVNIAIHAAPGAPARISVGYNKQHPVRLPPDQAHFDVGVLIQEHYDRDHQAGIDYCMTLANRISERAEVQNAGH